VKRRDWWAERPSAVLLAVLLSSGFAAPETRRPLETQVQAVRLIKQAAEAAAGPRNDFPDLVKQAAGLLDSLAAATGPALTPDLQKDLTDTAAELRRQADAPASRFSPEASLRLLERVGARLRHGDIPFQGSYSQSKVEEPVYGGHASAMGPPPEAPASANANAAPSPVQFEAVPGLTEPTFSGGRTKDSLLESGGSGVALLDYDGDGRLDVYTVSAFELDDKRQRIPHPSALYHNLGGWKFKNVAHEAGVDAATLGNGVCAGDFDGDGRLDLYVTSYGPNLLFRNNGDGTFSERAEAAGVKAGGWSTGCAFLDGNGDGHLDLYVARYATLAWPDVVGARRTMSWRGGPKVMVGPVGLPGAADLYYENRGDGTFAEATEARGLADTAPAYGFGVVATDYDNDGWMDLYVANDSNPNFLFHNRGGGRFESMGLLSGVALSGEGRAQAGMGVDAGDYDNDGGMDLVVTNFAHDSNTLYRNLGKGLFADVTQESGLAGPTFARMGWGTAFFDADLDGKLDLFFANGHIYPQVDEFPDLKETYRQQSQLFLSEGTTFRDVSDTAGGGLQPRRSSRGLAVGDIDDDGDLDLVISNVDEAPTLLESRQRTGHHWAGFRLKKDGVNPFAIGARVTVVAAGGRQIREVRSGGSYVSQSDLRAHFGLGDYAGPVDVEVTLGQGIWRWSGLAVDRYTTLVLRAQDRVPRGTP
jgi:enediyne biosynthesis protein E4